MRLPRSFFRYHGGKYVLSPWIIASFPPHTIYVEPYGGAASVLLNKDRSRTEVYNDIDSDIVNLFRVMRDNPNELIHRISLTPFSREEFEAAYTPTDDPVEKARRVLIRANMGFGSAGASGRRTGFRSNATKSFTTPSHDWANLPPILHMVAERLRGVVIENRDATDVMRTHDSHKTLHYVDPPYVKSTRSISDNGNVYRHEMDDDAHAKLLNTLDALEGAVVLSGYASDLYTNFMRNAMGKWRALERETYADGAVRRREMLWIKAPAFFGKKKI